jgi:hypothetical protein
MWTAIIKPILLQRFDTSKNTSRVIFSAPTDFLPVGLRSTDFNL